MLIIPQALTHNIHLGTASNPRIALAYKWTNVPIIPLIISNNCIDDLVIHQIITTHKEGGQKAHLKYLQVTSSDKTWRRMPISNT